MQSAITTANEYIVAGIKCIPIRPMEKAPLHSAWSTEFLSIEQFQTKSLPNGGIGIVTGKVSGIICIDIDKKHGGLTWYEQHKDNLGNYIQESTPGGGYHLYFRYPENTPYLPSNGHFAKGVEIMADGGRYVITAPSGHPSGGHYKIDNGLSLTQVPYETDPPPAWLITELLAKNEARNKQLANPDYINSNGIRGDIPRCIQALENFPPAIEGQSGDSQTFRAAAICNDYGLTQIEALEVLTKHYNPRCKPMWDERGLRTKILNAYQYASNPAGIKVTQENKFTAEDCVISEWLKQPEIPSSPILAGVFDKGDKVVIIGKSKTRKSFFAQQLAFCLATARSFLQFPALEKCKVLIIQSEIKKHRYHARCLRMAERLAIDPSELDNIIAINARGCPDLKQLVQDKIRLHKPDIAIVDPFYKLIEGDENNSQDIKPILKTFDALAEETGAAIVYIHHDKKGSAGESELTDRGSGSGLLGRDFDSSILLAAHETLDNGLVVEFITRNYQSPDPFVIEWMNYCFGRSDALPRKKTARSAATGPKSKFRDMLAQTQKMLAKEYGFGNGRMRVSEFGRKLAELGMSRPMVMDVREELEAIGAIEIETCKAEKNKGSKFVVISAPNKEALAEELKDNEPWF